ncbi:hypothetical protein PROFUN_08811 [Planoprotostelium fungivorum]|uniref:Uncharacterized protein n=1 Tax=Planoprotostelium fungivorum TaxID=1890364 RepID=A0A2P6MVT7_9EUKA|nr:hypothetical protein PROFUN_08811 [Planoprotostelium fungivorum]
MNAELLEGPPLPLVLQWIDEMWSEETGCPSTIRHKLKSKTPSILPAMTIQPPVQFQEPFKLLQPLKTNRSSRLALQYNASVDEIGSLYCTRSVSARGACPHEERV